MGRFADLGRARYVYCGFGSCGLCFFAGWIVLLNCETGVREAREKVMWSWRLGMLARCTFFSILSLNCTRHQSIGFSIHNKRCVAGSLVPKVLEEMLLP